MNDRFDFEIIESARLASVVRAEVLDLCNSAYGEDVSHLFAAYTADVHVLARMGRVLVGHGMIVTRWLQAGTGPLLRTAYIELVATAEAYRNQGVGARMVKELTRYASANPYDLAALCPADTSLYGHLGWQYWRGPLLIRPSGNSEQKETPALIPIPEERVMILRLPGTPPLDLDQPLSAEWRGGGELW